MKVKSICVTVKNDQLRWLKDMVEKGIFANISHGVRSCIMLGKAVFTAEKDIDTLVNTIRNLLMEYGGVSDEQGQPS